jgi:hypothetical protein
MAANNHLPGVALRQVLALVCLVLGVCMQAHAAAVDIRTASMGLQDGAWGLSARVDYRLTEEAREALANGVPLVFRVEVEVERVRRWLPNAAVVTAAHEWQLSYEPLSERYVVRYPDERGTTSHATVFGALNALGRVQGLPVAVADDLRRGETYAIAVRARLSEQTLPAPLWYLGLWNAGFSMASEWYEWTLQP